MFHVSTMLPFTPDNPQQVRNSHAGLRIRVLTTGGSRKRAQPPPPPLLPLIGENLKA